MTDILLDKTSTMLAKVLDGTKLRQDALAANIANVDTPNYTRRDVSFEGQLRELAENPGMNSDEIANRMNELSFSPTEDTASPRRMDGNNVDIEREMVELAKNSLQFESAAQMLSMKLTGLKNAIREGRR